MSKQHRTRTARVVAAQRARLLERDGPMCWICGLPLDLTCRSRALSPSLDHVVPMSYGGNDTDENARLAHLVCNSSRGNRPPTPLGTQSRTWL